MLLALHSTSSQSYPPSPTIKLGPSGADSWVGGPVYALGPCGSPQWTLLWCWEFLPLPQPPQVFSVRDLETSFPHTGTLGCAFYLAPQLFLQVYLHVNVGLPSLQATSSSGPPAALLPQVLSTQLPVSTPPTNLDVSSLTPWLSNFHTVQFSHTSGCFLSLYFLLSFFWLCKKAQCVYLHLHLDQKGNKVFFN